MYIFPSFFNFCILALSPGFAVNATTGDLYVASAYGAGGTEHSIDRLDASGAPGDNEPSTAAQLRASAAGGHLVPGHLKPGVYRLRLRVVDQGYPEQSVETWLTVGLYSTCLIHCT
ncbi:unnamed protein product [Protopolystoma xenopodis]|uniref:Malectin domain-containing protein n=1 Tax=Protopolystoma xenopodis TaxID=117903 RepID=A0A3S5AR73_9PLAT|nr:unnamed protein product [Protopolystoma xenopodis]